MIRDFRVDDRDACDIEDHDFRLLLYHLHEHSLHDLMRALRIDGSDDRKKKDAVVNFDHWSGKLANGSLVTGHGFQIRGDIRVDRQSHVEEYDLAYAFKRLGSFEHVSLEMIQKPLVDEREVSAISAEIQFWGHADALMSGPDAQAVANVVEIACSREQAQKIAVLHFLHPNESRMIGEKGAALRLSHDQLVQASVMSVVHRSA